MNPTRVGAAADRPSSPWTAGLFIASRVLVVAIILVAAQATVVRHTFGARVIETRIELGQIAPVIQKAMVGGDAEWFRSIAISGYAPGSFDASQQRNWAFSPVWPLLVRAAGFLPFGVAGLVLANLCFFVGATLLMALSSGSLQSLNRYALSAWPAFYSLGTIIRDGVRREIWVACSAALLGVFCLLFA